MSIFQKLFGNPNETSTALVYPSSDYYLNNNEDDDDDESEDGFDDFQSVLRFQEELSNGALLFSIDQDDFDWAGAYVVVSPNGVPTVISSDLNEFSHSELEQMKQLAVKFYSAMKDEQIPLD